MFSLPKAELFLMQINVDFASYGSRYKTNKPINLISTHNPCDSYTEAGLYFSCILAQ